MRGSLSAPREQAGWLPGNQPLLLISPPGIFTIFLFSTCATYLGKLASLPHWPLWLHGDSGLSLARNLAFSCFPSAKEIDLLPDSWEHGMWYEKPRFLWSSHYCLLPIAVNQRSFALWVMESCCWVRVASAQ